MEQCARPENWADAAPLTNPFWGTTVLALIKTYRCLMATMDEFGYPRKINPADRYMPPVQLPPSTLPEDHARHADAYSAYQERFLQAFKERRHYTE